MAKENFEFNLGKYLAVCGSFGLLATMIAALPLTYNMSISHSHTFKQIKKNFVARFMIPFVSVQKMQYIGQFPDIEDTSPVAYDRTTHFKEPCQNTPYARRTQQNVPRHSFTLRSPPPRRTGPSAWPMLSPAFSRGQPSSLHAWRPSRP